MVKLLESFRLPGSRFVGVPVEGQRPLVFERKVLRGALKGVDVQSIRVERDWLVVHGAAGVVKTSFKARALAKPYPWEVKDIQAAWGEKERGKRNAPKLKRGEIRDRKLAEMEMALETERL